MLPEAFDPLGHARATTPNACAPLSPTAEDRTRRAAGDLLAGVLPMLAGRVLTRGGLYTLKRNVASVDSRIGATSRNGR